MADAAKGVRQLVLLHGHAEARRMVAPNDLPLLKIASEVLGDEKQTERLQLLRPMPHLLASSQTG